MNTLYKVLAREGFACHGGYGKWYLPENGEPGKWMSVIENIKPCVRGYHLCNGETQLLAWLGETIYKAEYRGKIVQRMDKIVVSEARLLGQCKHWTDRTARLFAADCANRALYIYERKYHYDKRPRNAIETARMFAEGKATKKEMIVAGDAALFSSRCAGYDATIDASGNAVWSAVWFAARNAAASAVKCTTTDAARSTAKNAIMAVSCDIANDADSDRIVNVERKWQTTLLARIIRGEIYN